MLKKSLSLVLAVLMLASVTFVSAASFSDMTSAYDWAKEAVETLSENGIINGYPEGTFKPANNITKEEAITLFGRTLGLSEELNESIVSLANVMFEDALEEYDTFAKDAAAYLLYKKVLTVDELDTYISASNKGKTLKRYEAATLIAKCLGGDVWLKSNPDVTLSFSDAKDVPAAAKGYVYFASEAGIIGSMDKDLNLFVPNGNVTRAQIATMIYRIFNRMQYTYVEGVIRTINTDTNTISVRSDAGEVEAYTINKNIAVMVDGKQAGIADLEVGQEVVITFSNDALYSIDIVSGEEDENTYVAVYKGKNTNADGTTVKFTTLDTNESKAYLLANDATITYDGEDINVSGLKAGDYVFVTVKNDVVLSIVAQPKTSTVRDVTITNIAYDPDVIITVKDADDNYTDYAVKEGVKIHRNNFEVDFADLAVGDKAILTLEYGIVSIVNATGTSKRAAGTIEEIKISNQTSTITITDGESTKTYALSRDVKITIDGASANIYALRLGYEVDFDLSSETIKKLSVTSVATTQQITGQITLINKDYAMIRVKYVDESGNAKEESVMVKSDAKILDSTDNKIKRFTDLAVGQTVLITGAENVGVFEAASIMILSTH